MQNRPRKRFNLLQHRLSGFSLIEVSIGLIIMGLLVGGALKGKQLIRSARLNAVANQMKEIEMALGQYKDVYGVLPGEAADGSLPSQKDSWQACFSFLNKEPPEHDHLSTKIGGQLSLERDPEGLVGTWLVLSQDSSHSGLLTPQEAKSLLNKLGESLPNEGSIRVLNGRGATTCLTQGALNMTEKAPVCILAAEVA